MTRIVSVVAAVAMVAGPGCANRYVNGAALAASTAALACDWAQTRNLASIGWTFRAAPDSMFSSYSTHEKNPFLGRLPSTAQVDIYFASAALLNVALWAFLPRRYKAVVPIVVTTAEIHTASQNAMRDAGVCGLAMQPTR